MKATQATFTAYLGALNRVTLKDIKDIFMQTAYINWADYTLPTS